MICKPCALMADAKATGFTHVTTEKPKPGPNWLDSLYWLAREEVGGACKGETHCDCQHREPGTAFDPIYKRNEWLAKRINEGLPIA